jgi:hypothetical protein
MNFKNGAKSRLTIDRGIINNGCRYGAALNRELQRLPGIVGQAGKAGSASNIGSAIEFYVSQLHEPIFDRNVDLHIVYTLAGLISYRKVGSARPNTGV